MKTFDTNYHEFLKGTSKFVSIREIRVKGFGNGSTIQQRFNNDYFAQHSKERMLITLINFS